MNSFINKFNLINITSFLISVYILYFICAYAHYDFDQYNFLYNFKEKFSDFIELTAAVKNKDPYFRSEAWHISFYPPAGYGLISLLNYFGIKSGAVSFIKWILLNLILLSIAAYKLSQKYAFKISLNYLLFFMFFIFSYPFYYAVDRGNLEAIAILLIFIAISLKNRYLSTIFIGAAGAIKIVPILFCLLYFDKKNIKYLLSCLFFFVLITIISLSYFDAFIIPQFKQFFTNISLWGHSSLVNPIEYANYEGPKQYILASATTDLFDAIRIICLGLNYYTAGSAPYFYYKISILIFLFFIILAIPSFSENERFLVIAILCTITLPLTYIYRLTFLYISAFLLIQQEGSRFIILLISFLLIPKSFIQIFYKVDINSLLIPFILLGILIFTLKNTYRKGGVLIFWRDLFLNRRFNVIK